MFRSLPEGHLDLDAFHEKLIQILDQDNSFLDEDECYPGRIASIAVQMDYRAYMVRVSVNLVDTKEQVTRTDSLGGAMLTKLLDLLEQDSGCCMPTGSYHYQRRTATWRTIDYIAEPLQTGLKNVAYLSQHELPVEAQADLMLFMAHVQTCDLTCIPLKARDRQLYNGVTAPTHPNLARYSLNWIASRCFGGTE
jgi:hypothetical protein